MGKPKRTLLATAEETETPPISLKASESIARIRQAEGNSIYSVDLPGVKGPILVEMPSQFRSQIWVRRGGFVVVDIAALEDRSNKLGGEIANVVREEKRWRKMSYW